MANPADAKKPDEVVRMSSFPGLVNNVDLRNLPPGAAGIQVNITCIRTGEMVVRGGLRQVLFQE